MLKNKNHRKKINNIGLRILAIIVALTIIMIPILSTFANISFAAPLEKDKSTILLDSTYSELTKLNSQIPSDITTMKSSDLINLYRQMINFTYYYSISHDTLQDTMKTGYVDFIKTLSEKIKPEYDSRFSKYKGNLTIEASETYDQKPLDSLKETLELLLDELTIKTGGDKLDENGSVIQAGETLTPEEIKTWATENKENYKEYIFNYQNIIPNYEYLDQTATVDDIKVKAGNWSTKFDQLLKSLGETVNWENDSSLSKDITEGSASTVKTEIFDLSTDKFTDEYIELFSWTSNFVPFETRIDDPYNLTHLSQGAIQLYTKYGRKRLPILVTQTDKGVINSIKRGVQVPVAYISLEEFVSSYSNREMAFFISSDSAKEVEQKKVDSVNNTDTTQTTGEVATKTTNKGHIGPLYISPGNNNFSLNSLQDSGANKSLEEQKALNQDGSKLLDVLVNISASHVNMNYASMMNVLLSKTQDSAGIQNEMSRPLYVDFLGNILTESGYVVIPAASNYTYYTSKFNLPMFNAMIFDSYPIIDIDSNGNIMTQEKDKDKFILSKSNTPTVKKWQWVKMNKNGNTPKIKLDVEPPKTKSPMGENITNSDGADIEFINEITDLIEAGDPFKVLNISVGDQRKFYQHNGVTIQYIKDGEPKNISLKMIPSEGRTLHWKAMTEIYERMLEERSLINTKLLYYTATTVAEADDNVDAMLLTNYYDDIRSKLKKDPLISITGSLFETLHNKLFGGMETNFLMYTPSLKNLPIFKNTALWVVPLVTGLMLISFILFVILFVFTLFKKIDIDLMDVGKSLLMVTLIAAFTLKGMPLLTETVFNFPIKYLTNQPAMLNIVDLVEEQYKSRDNNFFDLSERKAEVNPQITLEVLKGFEVKDLRGTSGEINDRPELFSIFYMAEYDNTPFNLIGDKVYLQNNKIKINVLDLFETNQVNDKVTEEGGIILEHTYSGYGEIANFMPYYNFTESIVHTINGFTDGSKIGYRILPYQRDFYKSTGRFDSYTSSIFFIAPDKVNDYLEASKKKHQKNFQDSQATGDNPDPTTPDPTTPDPTTPDPDEEQPILDTDDTVLFYDNQVEQAIMYITESMGGDLEDWLGIKRILYMKENNAPFAEDSKSLVMSSKWFPSERALNDEFVDRKIKLINNNTKKFVMDYLAPISSSVSDETLIKATALYATMQFNKYFSPMFGQQIYPQNIEASTLSNDFTTKLSYIPLTKLFSGNSNKLGLLLAVETSYIGLFLGLLNAILFGLRSLIRIVGILIVIISPFLLFLLYVTRKSRNSQYIWGIIITSISLVLLFLVEILVFRMNIFIVNSSGDVMVGMVSTLVTNAIMTATYIYMALGIARNSKSFGMNFYIDSLRAVQRATNSSRFSGLSRNLGNNIDKLEDRLGMGGVAGGTQSVGYNNLQDYLDTDITTKVSNQSVVKARTNNPDLTNRELTTFKDPMDNYYQFSSKELMRWGVDGNITTMVGDKELKLSKVNNKSQELKKMAKNNPSKLPQANLSKEELLNYNPLMSKNPQDNVLAMNQAIASFYDNNNQQEKEALSGVIKSIMNDKATSKHLDKDNYKNIVEDINNLSSTALLSKLKLPSIDEDSTYEDLISVKQSKELNSLPKKDRNHLISTADKYINQIVSSPISIKKKNGKEIIHLSDGQKVNSIKVGDVANTEIILGRGKYTVTKHGQLLDAGNTSIKDDVVYSFGPRKELTKRINIKEDSEKYVPLNVDELDNSLGTYRMRNKEK